MVDGFAVLASFDHRADKKRGNLVVLRTIVLIPGHHQQTVIGFCPLDIGIDVLLQPGIPLLNSPIMHIILQVGYYNGDRG